MTPTPTAPDPSPARPPPAARRLLHLAALGVSLFVLVRVVLVEPFGVPTGSMAPALYGIHRSAACPRCDAPVAVGEPGPDARTLAWDRCRCPNCGLALDLSAAKAVPGNRLLVDKTAFRHRPPRRWEVAVFDCPADRSKPYVKRLVGLPGEFVQVSDGDVYADGELLRKTLPQVRELLVPVFDMGHAPDGGWGQRWLLENAELRGDELVLDGRERPATATYRHWNLDAGREEWVDGWLGYNGGTAERRGSFAKPARGDAAHDFVAVFDVEVTGDGGFLVCEVHDGADAVQAALMTGGDPDSWLSSATLECGGELRHPTADHRLRPGRRYQVEVAFVDRRASLAVDGVEVVPPLDMPAAPPGAAGRSGVNRPVLVRADRLSAVVSNFRLFRDVHYLPFGVAAAGHRLGPADYFALGDNTANSHDSRTWQVDGRPAPGVPAAGLIGKPFLVHQPMRLARLPVGDRTVPVLDWERLRLLR